MYVWTSYLSVYLLIHRSVCPSVYLSTFSVHYCVVIGKTSSLSSMSNNRVNSYLSSWLAFITSSITALWTLSVFAVPEQMFIFNESHSCPFIIIITHTHTLQPRSLRSLKNNAMMYVGIKLHTNLFSPQSYCLIFVPEQDFGRWPCVSLLAII